MIKFTRVLLFSSKYVGKSCSDFFKKKRTQSSTSKNLSQLLEEEEHKMFSRFSRDEREYEIFSRPKIESFSDPSKLVKLLIFSINI